MRRSKRLAWWTAYAVGSAAVLGGLAWTTVRVYHLEEEEAAARAENDRQATLRLALWRMDSWLAPRFARESARAWYEYEPYHPQTIAFNRLLEPIADGEILVPSPLLLFASDWLPLHFQWRADTGFTSPQVPSVAPPSSSIACGPVSPDPSRSEHLVAWTGSLDGSALERRLASIDLAGAMNETPVATATSRSAPQEEPEIPQQRSLPAVKWAGQSQTQTVDPGDFKARSAASNYAQNPAQEDVKAVQSLVEQTGNRVKGGKTNFVDQKVDAGMTTTTEPERPPTPTIGSLTPLWMEGDRLIVARRVELGDRTLVQGAFVDWPKLRQLLLAQVTDLLEGVSLEPDRGNEAGSSGSLRLASLPARLVLPPSQGAIDAPHPAAAGLVLVWLAAFGAIGATGLALRASIGAAVRTSRFASSVTHELRTPLTTFRLYSEMLADGVVRDPERMQEYFATLRDESARLGLLVENVLAWSRAEDGRAPREPRPMTVGDLVETVQPVLARRCAEAGDRFATSVEAPTTVPLVTDPDRVRQILFNLVDNACKYAGPDATVQLTVQQLNGHLRLAIDDSGPGVPDDVRKRVFRPFDRGERGPGDAVRGLGLGLAISTELARGLGGSVRCDASPLGGARFALELPLKGAVAKS